MKDKILQFLIECSPAEKTAVELGFKFGAETEKEAFNLVLQPLNELIEKKVVQFDFVKATQTFYYRAVI